MSRQALRAEDFLGTEFNEFLFAPVSAGRKGGQLSVVSALARLDLDAWAEAAALARLPRDIAAGKLSVLLGKAVDFPQTAKETQTIALQLVALLPGRAQIRLQISARPPASGMRVLELALLAILALAIGAAGFMLAMQLPGPVAHAQAQPVPSPQATAAPDANDVQP